MKLPYFFDATDDLFMWESDEDGDMFTLEPSDEETARKRFARYLAIHTAGTNVIDFDKEFRRRRSKHLTRLTA